MVRTGLGCRDELKRAVSKFGVMADDVARALGKSWLHSTAAFAVQKPMSAKGQGIFV